jgi:hypothetical protein
MTIVTDADMDIAYQYMAEHPHPESLAEKDLADAENEADRILATVYAEQSGSIRDKELACELDRRVGEAKAAVAAAKGTLREHRARVRWAEMCHKIWDRQQVMIRDREKVR